MFHLVKLVFLLSILSGTANAQWGTVVAQSDTNRFITSQYNYGLVMPHQEVIVGLLDTTITSAAIGGGNAFKVIVGSLLDHEDNCANYSIVNGVASCAGSYELWREMEKSTSWYQADRGDTTAMFPTNYAITISTGKDSVNIWNRDTAELWMAFVGGGSNLLRIAPPSNPINNFAFKDGQFYAATESYAFGTWDMLESYKPTFYSTDGAHQLEGVDIQTRNDGTQTWGGAFGSGTLAITNTAVNTVAVVRDPFGLKDALGRPKHWWVVGTDADVNTYNPHTDNIYKWGWGADDIYDVAIDESGYIMLSFLDGSVNRAIGRDSEFIRSAVDLGAGANHWASDNTGDGDIAWAADVRGTDIVLAERVPWAQNRPRTIYSSAAGVYNLYSGNPNITSAQARQRFSATVNAPLELGDALLALALEDNTTDSSPYANTMTANNSPGTVAAVFGNGYSSTVSSYLSRTDTDFNAITCATDVGGYMHYWFKTASTTNPAADAELVAVDRSTGDDSFRMYMSTGGLLVGYFYDTAASSNPVGNTDFADAKWHHVVWTVDCGDNLGSMYVDGVLHVSAAYTGTSALGLNVAQIGAKEGPSNYFDGIIDDVVIGAGTVSAESAAKLHAEGRKKLAMGTPVFAGDRDTGVLSDAFYSNNVVDIDALDNGMWAVAFSDANTVQVFDGRIPIQQIAAPAGTVKSVALIQSPGTDSVGVAIGTTTNLKFVQPSVNLRAAMAHQYKEPIHVGETVVVDSAGIDGIFWTAADGVVAGVNAGRTLITPLRGTYGITALSSNDYILRCSSPKNSVADLTGVLFDNGGGSTPALTISGSGVEVSNCGFRTGSGSSGGNQNAVLLSGSFINFHHNRIVDSDVSGVSITAAWSSVSYNNFTGHDGDCISLSVSGTTNNNVTNNICGDAGEIHLYTGANDNIVIGNIIDATIADDGTNNTVSPNTIY